jgi:hypothetical protein
MFCVDEATSAAIRQVYEANGELSAAVELRRHFPGITNNETARRCRRDTSGNGITTSQEGWARFIRRPIPHLERYLGDRVTAIGVVFVRHGGDQDK